MILCIENSKDSNRKLLELINIFGKIAGHKLYIQKLVAFYTSIMNYQKEKLEKKISFAIVMKTIRQ